MVLLHTFKGECAQLRGMMCMIGRTAEKTRCDELAQALVGTVTRFWSD
jgi:hypothetical protein